MHRVYRDKLFTGGVEKPVWKNDDLLESRASYGHATRIRRATAEAADWLA